MKKQGGQYNYELIRKAYELCVAAHEGQMRFSNEEFYIHPLSVAKIVVTLGMDSQSIAAALLHDTVEDTSVTLEQIEKEFGGQVKQLVDGVTKLGKISFTTKEQLQAENIRKMFMAMAKDIRVIIIKLADRLHNMRTIDAMTDYKQREKSVETLELYAPIAHRLGIRQIKEELEDLSIKHLDPVAYAEIEELLKIKKAQRESILENIQKKIENRLKEVIPNVNVEIHARVKSIHGIYRKMYVQGRDFDEIYDIYALRIITDTVTDCYNILGLMHDLFRPIPGRFKDYISMPKPNRYQSLHTTVIGREAIPFEIQIRTAEMHRTAEYGIAAHWKYKEGITENNEKMEEQLAWVRQILETQTETSDNDILSTIKVDLAQEDVFGVTPKGDVINLPAGSTVIDFAFAIHSAVGTKMVGAKVNGKIVPINHVITTGEVIDILTSNQDGKGPNRDWLNIAVTNQAKSKIRAWFKKEKRAENIENGKEEIEIEFRRNSITFSSDEQKEEFITDLAAKQHFSNAEDFYAAIGYGGIILTRILPRIKDDYNKLYKSVKIEKPEEIEVKPVNRGRSSDGVIVDGLDDCLIKFSKCCAPLPGDEIIGFITRGRGVSIHKRDCNNVPRDMENNPDAGRWVSAHWSGNTKRTSFTSTLRIMGIDRDGFLADVTVTLFNMHISLHKVNAFASKSGDSVVEVTVSAENLEHLRSIITHLEKIRGVFSVERLNQ
ncbi:MAG: bifunctional (p)ppGpp synthetase/guanosine-3',5'-bis(diphosphate) 3'-pyrophosphohydrolase [Clostridiales bacterium]|nr:bifunctional (p)ppGpp synthetase/guanosine-3',5'-bis(diphosphate) 3'-pyrophosphohydrolase [Candidatus Equinaster intestinalis]